MTYPIYTDRMTEIRATLAEDKKLCTRVNTQDREWLLSELAMQSRHMDEQRRIINQQRDWLGLWTARCDRVMAAAKRMRAAKDDDYMELANQHYACKAMDAGRIRQLEAENAKLKQGIFLRIEE